jgi:hypothetical protein
MKPRIVTRAAIAALVLFACCAVAQRAYAATKDVANKIAEGVGKVGQTKDAGAATLFVFEENHASRAGQLQIAVMLLRLYRQQQATRIVLEGLIAPGTLDGRWFQQAGGAGVRTYREDVAVRMLAEGEIGAAEFMALLFPDVTLHGPENAADYAVELNVKGSPSTEYLLSIADKLASDSDRAKVNDLLNAGQGQKATEFLLSRDAWVAEHYRAVQQPMISHRGVSVMYDEIVQKARDLQVPIEPETGKQMAQVVNFWKTARKRSLRIGSTAVEAARSANRRPIAVSLGAGHTEEVLDLLQQGGLSFALLTPRAGLDPDTAVLTPDQLGRKDRRQFVRVTPGTLGGLLNAQRKPPPIVDTAQAQSWANMYLVSELLAEAVRNGNPPLLDQQMKSLTGVRVDPTSLERDGYDVLFKAFLSDTSGHNREVWARVGTTDEPYEVVDLEKKLERAIDELDGRGRRPPKGTAPTDEGLADGKRGDVVINRVGMRALDAFAASKDQVQRLGKVSS